MAGETPIASSSGDAATEEPAMTLDQFKEQLAELNKGLRSLPATAQVTPLCYPCCLLLLLLLVAAACCCCCCLLQTFDAPCLLHGCCWCLY